MTALFLVESITPYLVEDPAGKVLAQNILFWVSGGVAAAGLIMAAVGMLSGRELLGGVGLFAFVLGPVVVLAFAGTLASWEASTAEELSEQYGVEITSSFLEENDARLRVLEAKPSVVPLPKKDISQSLAEELQRNEETGIFAVTGDATLYLLFDGRVLEVVTRDGNNYTPYSPAPKEM